MFELVADESSQTAGIEVHKKRRYSLTSSFLKGVVWHDSTSQDFSAYVGPNYGYLAAIADDVFPNVKANFNEIRGQAFGIGDFPALDAVAETVRELEEWYKTVLQKHGASKYFLQDGGNGYHLVPDDHAADLSFGQLIIQARNVQAFQFLRDNKPLTHKTVVSKIMPLFLQALGLKEYYLEHDLAEGKWSEVRFIIKDVGMFAFLQPSNPNNPAYFERYSYYNGDYHRSFSGEAKGDVIRQFVFQWLVDAAKEKGTLPREDYEAHLDELTKDIRRTWIATGSAAPPSIFEKMPKADTSNVIRLGQFRHS